MLKCRLVRCVRVAGITYYGAMAVRYRCRLRVAIKVLPSNTFRKMIVKIGLVIAILCGFDRLVFFSNTNLSLLLARLASNAGVNYSSIGVRWHTDSERARCYVYYLDKEFRTCGFGKVVFDDVNMTYLRREVEALRKIDQSSTNVFAVPSVLGEFKCGDAYGVMFSAVPEEYIPLHHSNADYPYDLLQALRISSRLYSLEAVQNTSWWLAFSINMAGSDFFSMVKQTLNCSMGSGVTLGQAHGDLGSENIFIQRINKVVAQYLLIDWERFAEDAPTLSDTLAFWLGKNHRQIFSLSEGDAFYFFRRDFIERNSYTVPDALLALAFMASVKFDVALVIANSFRFEDDHENISR